MVESRAGLFLCVTGDPIKAGLAGGMCSMKVVIIGFFPEKAKDRIRGSFPCTWDVRIVLPEEVEQEKAFINDDYFNQNGMMISCIVDGKIAGNCQISFRTGMKDRHRASVAIALLQEFWNLGIGTKMFKEMFQIARERNGVRQIELDFIEGNSRARHLYEKMGFRITGVKPDAIRMKDGTYVNEYMMLKLL